MGKIVITNTMNSGHRRTRYMHYLSKVVAEALDLKKGDSLIFKGLEEEEVKFKLIRADKPTYTNKEGEE